MNTLLTTPFVRVSSFHGLRWLLVCARLCRPQSNRIGRTQSDSLSPPITAIITSMLRFFAFIAVFAFTRLAFSQAGIPPTPKKPVTDEYHGVKITDDYRWLEDWSNPETRAWSDFENLHARQYLDSLTGRERLRDQIKTIISAPSTHFDRLRRGGDDVDSFLFAQWGLH